MALNSAFGYQAQPDGMAIRGQSAGLSGAFGVESATQPSPRLLEAELAAKAYKPQTYDLSSLSFRDDGAYSGDTRLNPLDVLSRKYQVANRRSGRNGDSIFYTNASESSPLWALAKRGTDFGGWDDDLESKYTTTRNNRNGSYTQVNTTALERDRAARAAAFARHSLTPEQVFDQFRGSGNRDYLYGAYGTSQGPTVVNDGMSETPVFDHYGQHGDPSDPYNWSGRAITRQQDARGNMAYANSQAVRGALESMPELNHLTLKQLDEYAAKTLNGRPWQHYWGTTPGEIVREIAAKMPQGLPKSGQDWISQNNAQWVADRKKAKKGIHKAEDAASGLTGMLGDIGPLGNLLYFTPLAPAWGALNAAAGIEGLHEKTMKPLQAGLRIAGGALGALKGLSGAPTPFDAATRATGGTGSVGAWFENAPAAIENGGIGGLFDYAAASPLADFAQSQVASKGISAALDKLAPQQKQRALQQIAQQRQQRTARPGQPNRAFGLANFQG